MKQPPARPHDAPYRRRAGWLALALLVCAVAIAFLPALHGGFFWDDDDYVVSNLAFRTSPGNAARLIWTRPFSRHYHPLTLLSFQLEHLLWGLDPVGYHTTNLLLHLANVVLVWTLVRRLAGSHAAAWVAALLWGIHPLRVESVAWIASRKDLLYTLFFLAGLVCWLNWTERRRKRDYAAALALFVLSALSKGMAVAFPLALVLVDYLERRPAWRSRLKETIPFFAVAGVFGAIAMWASVLPAGLDKPTVLGPLTRALLPLYALTVYLAKTIWPAGLSCFYPYPEGPTGRPPPGLWLAPVALAAVAAGTWWSLRWTRKVAFGVLFFVAAVIFVLRPVGGALLAERYTYLASVGLAYLAGEGYVWLRRRARPGAIEAAALLAALALGAATWRRASVWADPMTLWTDILEKHPDAWVAYQNRGSLRERAGDRPGALADFEAAIRVQPLASRSYNSRGNLRFEAGDSAGAAADFDESIRLDPSFAEAHYNLAYSELQRGDYAAAVRSFDGAIRLDPRIVQAWFNRAEAKARLGRDNDAVEDYGGALRVDPGFAPALYGRGRARQRLGDTGGAADIEAARRMGFTPR